MVAKPWNGCEDKVLLRIAAPPSYRHDPMTTIRPIKPTYLSELATIEILWPGDVRVLAEFILRACNARDQELNSQNRRSQQRSRPTLQGLAGHFARLTNIPVEWISQAFQAHGLGLGATVEFDAPSTELSEPSS